MLRYVIFASLLLLYFRCSSQEFVRSELNVELDRPWEIVYGPDGYLWLSEKNGTVSRVHPKTAEKQIVYQAADYFAGDDSESNPFYPEIKIGAGTYGLALHPDFLDPNSSYIYLFHSVNGAVNIGDPPRTEFVIKRITWDAISLAVVSDTIIVDQLPSGYDHSGGRMVAVKQNGINYLYVTTGDNGASEKSCPDCYQPPSDNPNLYTQDPYTKNGKTLRFNMDGSIPSDNPIPGNPMFTRGHRNPQGLTYNPKANLIYGAEHGDDLDDEVNVLYPGMNYGWRDVRGYHGDESHPGEGDYADQYQAHPDIPNDALIDPLYAWCTQPLPEEWCTVAPSDVEYYGSSGIPEWENSLLVVTLKDGLYVDKEVYQFKLNDDGSLKTSTIQNPNPKKFFGEDQDVNGRLRDLTFSPDGKTIYLINNGAANNNIKVYRYQENLYPELRLFPNPSSMTVSIQGLEGLQDVKVTLFNSNGQEVVVNTIGDSVFNIEQLSVGIYFLKVQTENDSRLLKLAKM